MTSQPMPVAICHISYSHYYRYATLIMMSFATEAGPWALATPSVTDVQTTYHI